MKLQHTNEWYGAAAILLEKRTDYNLISYQCDGTRICRDYPLLLEIAAVTFN